MIPEWIFVVTAAIGGLSGLATVILSRRKMAAEAENLTIGSASHLVETVMKQLDYLDGEVGNLRGTITKYRAQVEEAARTEERLTAEIRDLRSKVRTLIGFIEDQGLDPPLNIDTAPNWNGA